VNRQTPEDQKESNLRTNNEIGGNERVKIEPKTTFANERVFQTLFS